LPIEVKKQERENSQNVIRRFSRAVRQSGVLRRARDNRFRKRPKSALAKKKAAIRKDKRKKEYQKRQKMEKSQ